MDNKRYIGVDLGGTNIKCGVVTKEGEILYQKSIPTKADRPADEVIADMVLVIRSVIKDSGTDMSDVVSIGVGSPGAIDSEKGEVIKAGNLSWKYVKLKKKLEDALEKPAYVANDANVAALAEALFGAGKGKKSTLLMTLGTGLGAGYVLDGKIQSGAHGVGAELGHMIIVPEGKECTCGNKGCFERYTSASALIAWGVETMENDPNSSIAKRAGSDKENVTAKLMIDLAKEGDEVALKIFDDYTRYLAYGIVNLINIIDPEVIILGGGVSRAGDFLLDSIKPKVASRVFCKEAPYSEILISKMGNDAGVVGAAMLS